MSKRKMHSKAFHGVKNTLGWFSLLPVSVLLVLIWTSLSAVPEKSSTIKSGEIVYSSVHCCQLSVSSFPHQLPEQPSAPSPQESREWEEEKEDGNEKELIPFLFHNEIISADVPTFANSTDSLREFMFSLFRKPSLSLVVLFHSWKSYLI